jgi:hypothetical protein
VGRQRAAAPNRVGHAVLCGALLVSAGLVGVGIGTRTAGADLCVPNSGGLQSRAWDPDLAAAAILAASYASDNAHRFQGTLACPGTGEVIAFRLPGDPVLDRALTELAGVHGWTGVRLRFADVARSRADIDAIRSAVWARSYALLQRGVGPIEVTHLPGEDFVVVSAGAGLPAAREILVDLRDRVRVQAGSRAAWIPRNCNPIRTFQC